MKRQSPLTDLTRLEPREEPNVTALLSDMRQTISDSAAVLSRLEQNDDVLECRWDGQSPDGRMRKDAMGCDPFPWEGASDAQIPFCEDVVTEKKLVIRAAQRAGKMQAQPRENADAGAAALITPVLNYVFGTLMRQNLFEETSYAADWMLSYGSSLMHVCWHREESIEEATISAEQLLQMAFDMGMQTLVQSGQVAVDPATGQPALAPEQAVELQTITQEAVMELLYAEERRPQLIEALMSFDDRMTKAEAVRVATALAAGKDGVYHRPYTRESKPRVETLLPFVDVFFPIGTTDIQRAPWVARMHWLTAVELEARAESEKWDAEWLAAVKDAGPGQSFDLGSIGITDHPWTLAGVGVRSEISLESARAAGLYQIIEVHRRALTKSGVPWVYRIILHGRVAERCALCEPLPYHHAKYPYVAFRRQRRKRAIASSTGIPQRGQAFQDAMKFHHDTEAWRTELATTPPYTVPTNRAGGRQNLSPFAEVPEKRAGSFKWMEPPPFERDAVAVQNRIFAQAARHFRLTHESVDPSIVMMDHGELVEDWFTGMSEVTVMVVQLLQQYMDPIVSARVAGQAVPLNATREEIQGQYDIGFTFDPRDLNADFFAKKLEYLSKIVTIDSQAVINRAEVVAYVFSAIDPQLAARAIKPPEQADQDEIEDEQRNLSAIALGMTPVPKMGVNYALRAQILQTAVQQNPRLAQLAGSDPLVADAFDKRWKFLQMQIKQEANKTVGVLGYDPQESPLSQQQQ